MLDHCNEAHGGQNFFHLQASLGIILATPVVLSNTFSLITIYQTPKEKKKIRQIPATLFMVNLRICDLLAGLVPEYGFVFYDICIVRGHMQGSLVGLPILAFSAPIVTNVVSSGAIAVMSLTVCSQFNLLLNTKCG